MAASAASVIPVQIDKVGHARDSAGYGVVEDAIAAREVRRSNQVNFSRHGSS
jgi:hypothetical protein